MSERYLCIHGHFYQPPRENPWLEAVETEPSAVPYHDWNERITDECYAANLAARILDGSGRIISIVNNYSRLSHDFGPTLLSWLETEQPEVYTALIQTDRETRDGYDGHGPAIAQAYNHVIMPLANRRDKETQVVWGIEDFRRRYGRDPEGMWLPETAVDYESLEIMAAHGIKFTILSPHQAGRVRQPGGLWYGGGARIDTLQPYRCPLPSGGSIAIFFYHAELSRGIAFDGLLRSGDALADSVLSAYDRSDSPRLITIATDGETYGHHHKFGEMALAYAFDRLESAGVRLVTPAQYLAINPPHVEVEIIENTSWSCSHGIERWKSDCGCSTGMHPGWNQRWRKPLRQVMDQLRDRLVPLFEVQSAMLLKDPWAARNDYISLIAGGVALQARLFFDKWAVKPLDEAGTVKALELLELQRSLMASYTSCGWFFDDIAGLESVLVLKQAGRVLELANRLFGQSPEADFLGVLRMAVSNVPAEGNGRDVYVKKAQPLSKDLQAVAVHYALDSFFSEYGTETRIFAYQLSVKDRREFDLGGMRVAGGDVVVSSNRTGERRRFIYGALFLGAHNLHAGVTEFIDETVYANLIRDLKKQAENDDCRGCIQFLEKRFAGSVFILGDVFSDARSRIIDTIFAPTLAEAEASHRSIYQRQYEAMKYFASMGHLAPQHFLTSAAFILNTDIKRELESREPHSKRLHSLLAEVRRWEIKLDVAELSFTLTSTLETLMKQFEGTDVENETLERINELLLLFKDILAPGLWRLQNIYFALLRNRGDETSSTTSATRFARLFLDLGRLLSIKVD